MELLLNGHLGDTEKSTCNLTEESWPLVDVSQL